MYPQQVIASCHPANIQIFMLIPADKAYFIESMQLTVTMFSFVYFQVPEMMSSQYSRTSENVCRNHLTGAIFEIQTLNYLETFRYHTKFVHAPECAYCSIGKLVNCQFICSLFSDLYTLQYVLIVK